VYDQRFLLPVITNEFRKAYGRRTVFKVERSGISNHLNIL
jgi:hypothetical protein